MVRALVLALLLAFALPMGAAATPTGGAGPTLASPSLHEVAILTLDGPSRASFASASVDVSTAMAVQREAAASQLDRYALAERLENTPTTEGRQRLLFEAATDIEIRITALRAEARAVRTAYATREIDSATFLRRLARLHARTVELQTTLARIEDHAQEIPQFSIRGRVSRLDASLFGLEGPLQARALAAMRGEEPPVRLFVQASAEGTALSTIEDGRFVRSAYRTDYRDPGNVSGRGLNYALDRSAQLYPTAFNGSSRFRTGIDTVSGGLFKVEIELRQGLITAYLDGSTEQIFFEIQERRLDLLGPRPSVVGTANGTRLSVNRSYAGGPIQITVSDNGTGAPLATPVFVDDHRLETGPDGTVWTLAPAAVTFEVTAVGPAGNVTLSVRPLAPTPIIGEG